MTRTAIIIGASSGIGAALAESLARRGHDLGLTGRRTERLQALADQLRERFGIRTEVRYLDVCDIAAVHPVLLELSATLGGLDLLVANAGRTGRRRAGNGRIDIDRDILDTNLMGAIACIDAGMAIFKQQGRGHLVGISSISAFIGLPGSAAYSASKAALTNYLQALRCELGKGDIHVTTIHPGFVITELTPDMEKYPFAAKPEVVAEGICAAIERRAKEATVPRWPWAPLMPILKRLPDSLIRKAF